MSMYPPDFGPLYTETFLGRFPVEPANTYSNVIFLITIIIFALKTRLNFHKHPMILVSLPILFVGLIGGTVFHATRSDRIWLMLDYIPLMILVLLGAYYFWRRFGVGQLTAIGLIFLPAFVCREILFRLPIDIGLRISLGYTSIALVLVLPMILYLKKQKWENVELVSGAIVSFIFAIICRSIDMSYGAQILPMGTHFLWHIGGGLSTLLLFEYIFRIEAHSQQ